MERDNGKLTHLYKKLRKVIRRDGAKILHKQNRKSLADEHAKRKNNMQTLINIKHAKHKIMTKVGTL